MINKANETAVEEVLEGNVKLRKLYANAKADLKSDVLVSPRVSKINSALKLIFKRKCRLSEVMWDPYKKSIYFDTLYHNATVSDFYPNIIIVAKVKSHLPLRLVCVTHACGKQN
jgi:hypothetical protein